MKRSEHTFTFPASQIAKAADEEAIYHAERLAYWRAEQATAAEQVKATIGAKLVWAEHTGGGDWQTVIDYGDAAAQQRLSQASRKIRSHKEAADRFQTDHLLYVTQGERIYDLDTDDVHHYRLGGGPRDD